MNRKLENIVVFAILMQSNGGIIDKSPAYILEKFRCRNMGIGLLDPINERIFQKWKDKWDKEVK
jgi:hypothetical protein